MTRKLRLGLVTDAFEQEFQSSLLNIAASVAHNHDVDLIAVAGGVLHAAADSHRNFIYGMVGKEALDGVIFTVCTVGHETTPSKLADVAERFGVPTVAIGGNVDGLVSFHVDNEQSMYELCKHLIDHHKFEHLAFLSGPPGSQECVERQRGFERALSEAGYTANPEYIVQGDYLRASGGRGVAKLLDARGITLEHLDAIVCANDEMAVGALAELERRGIRVPSDVALTGFDDIHYARFLRVPLTTVAQPFTSLISAAIGEVLGQIRGCPPRKSAERLPASVVLRRSCGCVRPSRESRFPPTDATGAAPFEEAAARCLRGFRKALDPVVRSRLDPMRNHWDERMAAALAQQVRNPQERVVFLREMEDLLGDTLRGGGSVALFQDELLALRRAVVQAAPGEDLREAVDDLFDDTVVLTRDVMTQAQAQRWDYVVQQMRALNDVTAALLSVSDERAVFRASAEHLPRLGIRSGLISLFDHRRGHLESIVYFDSDGIRIGPVPASVGARALLPVIEGRVYVYVALSAPGEQLGVAAFEHSSEDTRIYERLRQTISAAVTHARLTESVKRAHQSVAQMAITDPLTGLPNRRHFTECLEKELSRKSADGLPFALLVLDLDGFKEINDRYGHDEGDRVLTLVAATLKGAVRESDTVARIGGDEFIVLLPGAPMEGAMAVAEHILESLKRTHEGPTHVGVDASIGVAALGPGQSVLGASDLFRVADQALLRAKRAGKGRAERGVTEPPL